MSSTLWYRVVELSLQRERWRLRARRGSSHDPPDRRRFFPFALADAVEAQEPAVMVGTGDPRRDVAAVQAAVDRGGTVVLKGTFDFGDRGRVLVRRSVSISGGVPQLDWLAPFCLAWAVPDFNLPRDELDP